MVYYSKWKTEVAVAGKLTGYLLSSLMSETHLLGLCLFLPDVKEEND